MTRFSSITNALTIIGSITDTNKNMYYSLTFVTSISDHPDISISSISATSTSNYVSFDGAFSITDIGSISLVSNTPVYSQIQISEDTSQSYASDVVYYHDTEMTITVNSETSFESTINTLCSANGSTSISYDLVSNGNDTLPTWVSFDQSSFKISGTSPELNATTEYTLVLESTSSGSQNAFQTNITINVTYD